MKFTSLKKKKKPKHKPGPFCEFWPVWTSLCSWLWDSGQFSSSLVWDPCSWPSVELAAIGINYLLENSKPRMLRRINPQSAGIFSPDGVLIYLVNTKISTCEFNVLPHKWFLFFQVDQALPPQTWNKFAINQICRLTKPALQSVITLTLLPLQFWLSSLISPAPQSLCRSAGLPPHPGRSLSLLQYQAQALQISVNTNIQYNAHLPG